MNEFIGSIVLWPAEQLINTAIAADAHVSHKLAAFAGKSIQINTEQPGARIRMVIESGSVRLSAMDSESYALPVDATIHGPTTSLLQQAFTDSSQLALAGNDVKLSGDVQLVQDLFSVLKSLDLDWQDYLSPFLGDQLTHQIGVGIEQSRAWAEDSGKRMRSSLDNYLKQEIRTFPSSQQLDSFSNDLDQLKLRIDRFGARLEKLKARLEARETGLEPQSTA